MNINVKVTEGRERMFVGIMKIERFWNNPKEYILLLSTDEYIYINCYTSITIIVASNFLNKNVTRCVE